jgi:CRISPR system Cascade subunit CasB
MSQPQTDQTAEPNAPTTGSVVGKVAYAMEHQLPTGDLAELRRISPDEPYTPALWKLLLSYVPDSWTRGRDQDEKERRWAALFMGMSLAGGSHDPTVPLGRALAKSGWSELRFVRLLRARGDRLFHEVRRVAQYLNSKGQSTNWTDVAQLLLNQEGEWAEKHRLRIARAYYRTLHEQDE